MKPVKEVSVSQTLVHKGNFDLPDICWECNMTGHKKSQRFWRMSGDNCHIPGIYVLDGTAKEDTHLDLLLTK